jgi:hypothetical protein
MAWCEANDLDFVFGLAQSERLIGEIKSELASADGGPTYRDRRHRSRIQLSLGRTKSKSDLVVMPLRLARFPKAAVTMGPS